MIFVETNSGLEVLTNITKKTEDYDPKTGETTPNVRLYINKHAIFFDTKEYMEACYKDISKRLAEESLTDNLIIISLDYIRSTYN